MKNPSVYVSSRLCGLRIRVLGNFLWISDFKTTILSSPLRSKNPNFLLLALTSILLLSATSQHAVAQDLYVGSNSSGQITNLTLGTFSYENTYVGYNSGASNNLLAVGSTNTLLTNSSDLYVGYSGGSNGLVVSNGATVAVTGLNHGTVIGYNSNSSYNSALVSGFGSLLINNLNLFVGNDGSGNLMVISKEGMVANTDGIIGYSTDSSNNSVLVTGAGSTWTNGGNLFVGYDGSGNSLVISNGGYVYAGGSYTALGWDSTSASNNSIFVAGTGNGINSTLDCAGVFYMGGGGSGNSLVISNGGLVYAGGSYLASSSNSVLVTGDGSLWYNIYTLFIGYGSTTENMLTIDNGGQVIAFDIDINDSNINIRNQNTVIVTGSGSAMTAMRDLYVGYDYGGCGNSLVISNGGMVANTYGNIGYATDSSNNSVLVTGVRSTWTNSGDLTIGYNGSDNTLTISDGGTVAVAGVINGVVIGLSSSSSNNSVLVSGSDANGISSTLSDNGNLYVGFGGSGTLTVANAGFVIAGAGMVIANEINSVGTLNIGSFIVSNTAGTIVTPTIAFGSGAGAINFNQINAFTLSSDISGNGSVNHLGTGTTILSGSNSYTGLTTISRGTLVAASTNALGSSDVILGGTTNAATLSLATNLTISTAGPPHYDLTWGSNGVIALAQGTHTLTLANGMINSAGLNDGVNVFQFLDSNLSNGTNVLINYGSLADFTTSSFRVQGVSGYSFSTDGNQISAYLSTNANVVVSNNTTINNTLTVGSFSVAGGATTVVAQGGTLNSTGDVLVSGNSTLDDNGLIVTPTLTVDQGSILKGVGTLQLTGGNLTVNGTFAPGNSPGTFFVTGGNLVMGSTAVWDEQVYSASVYDRVVVTGAAFLNGTMNITGYGSGGLEYGQKLNFLTASAGISGSFSSIIAPEGFRGRLLISGTEANILIAPSSYTLLARGHNQLQVARALDSFIPATSGDRLVVSTSLDSLTASQYNQAFNAIMPTMYQSLATIAFNEANALNMELNQRLWGVRLAEGGGFSMSGFADNTPMLEGQGDGKGVLDSKKDILRPGLDNHWGVFVDANGIFANANSANMLPGYNAESGGITAGLTYKWSENFASGIYTGYQGTYSKMGASGSGLGTGSTLIDNAVRFGVFGTYGQKDGKGLYLNGLAGGAYHNYQATRVIQYTGMNRAAKSSPGAGELDTMLATGYDIQKGKFTFGPTASLQYTYLGVNSVKETGAQSLNFNSGGWNSSSMLSSVGGHVAYNWMPRTGIVVVPQLSLSWQHEFLQNPYDITGNLGGTSPTFSNTSATGIRDYLYTGVGFTVEFGKKWNTSFFYNAAAGNSDLVSQNIFWSAGVKF
jgi:T5SS/PEP-CTERM-associated repeat protein